VFVRPRPLAALAVSATLLAGFAAAAPAVAAGGTSYSWVGSFNSSGGDDHSWTDANNWLPKGVPGNGDSVTITPPDVSLCHAHVDNTPSVALAGLTLEEAEPPGSLCEASVSGAAITVSNSFTWHGGTLDTPTTLLATSSGIVAPTAGVDDSSLLTQDLTVHGHLVLDGNLTQPSLPGQDLAISAGTALTVASDGTLDANDSNDINGSSCCVDPPRVVNDGVLRVNGGRLGVHAVEVDNNGRLATTAAGELRTSEAPQTAGAGASYTGNGDWQLYTASSTELTGTQTLGPDFHLVIGGNGTGGDEALTGAFSLAGHGTVDWNGGTIAAATTIGAAVTLRADGGSSGDARELDGGPDAAAVNAVTNHGTIRFTGGAGYYATENGRIVNASDGALYLGADTTLTGGCCLSPSVVENAGGVVTVGAGAHPVDLDNTRYVDHSGTTHVPAGQTLRLTGGAASLFDKNTFSGGGTVSVKAPVVARTAATVARQTTLRLVGYPGRIDGTATIGGAGTFQWTGGAVSGSLGFDTGDVAISGSEAKTIAEASGHNPNSYVTIDAPTTFADGTKAHPNEVDLQDTSKLTLAGSTKLGAHVLFSHGRIANTGVVRVEHPVTISAAGFANSGKVVLASGALRVDDDYTQDAGGRTEVELTASSGGAIKSHGRVVLHGRLTVVNLSGYRPNANSVRTIATGEDGVSLHPSCTTTAGAGATGHEARHWVAGKAGLQVRVHSVPGRHTSC
jgi:hypothetical protein